METEAESYSLPDGLQLSRAVLKDLYGIFAVEKESFPKSWSLDTLRQEFEHAFSRIFVCRKNEEVIGYICGWQIADEIHLLKIAVANKWRRRGVGSALLEKLVALSREKGVSIIYLEVRDSNVAAIKFYEKHGFSVAGRRKGYYMDSGEDALLMLRKIQP